MKTITINEEQIIKVFKVWQSYMIVADVEKNIADPNMLYKDSWPTDCMEAFIRVFERNDNK